MTVSKVKKAPRPTTLSRMTFSIIIKRDTQKNGSVIMPIVANKPFMLSVLVLNVVAPSRILGRTLNSQTYDQGFESHHWHRERENS